ncbi:MAG: hypothetical protein VX378_06285 [Pseudomonadota bacterium]|nr:hypothetical protein [Pseudomonadota bacterium]
MQVCVVQTGNCDLGMAFIGQLPKMICGQVQPLAQAARGQLDRVGQNRAFGL